MAVASARAVIEMVKARWGEDQLIGVDLGILKEME